MNLNMEAAQLVVGAAILDSTFRGQLFADRMGALKAVERQPAAPSHVRLTAQDRRLLASIQATDLQQFAVGVERLRRSVRATGISRPAPFEEAMTG